MTSSSNCITSDALNTADLIANMKKMMADFPSPPSLFKPFTVRDVPIKFDRHERPSRFDYLYQPQPMRFMGLTIVEHDLPRTPIYQRIRPRCPAKRAGRSGTRRAWKRAHPPRTIIAGYEDAPIYLIGDAMVATPEKVAMIKRASLANAA